MSDTDHRIFRLEVDRELGALERVLSVARRRGIGLERLTVEAKNDATWNVQIKGALAASEASLAISQFTALVDVRTVVMEDA